MVNEWEKQILAYCMRVSRGIVLKGIIKMSVFDDTQAQLLGGVSAVQLIDIISYVARLHKNLTDAVRRRGFECTIEIGSKVQDLLMKSGYDLNMFQTFKVDQHDGYEHEIKFNFTYEPQAAPTMAFEDVEVDEQKSAEDHYIQEDQNLENLVYRRIMETYHDLDDLILFQEDNTHPDQKEASIEDKEKLQK